MFTCREKFIHKIKNEKSRSTTWVSSYSQLWQSKCCTEENSINSIYLIKLITVHYKAREIIQPYVIAAGRGAHSCHTQGLVIILPGTWCLPTPSFWCPLTRAAAKDAAPTAMAGTEPGGLGIIVVGLPAPDWAWAWLCWAAWFWAAILPKVIQILLLYKTMFCLEKKTTNLP